MTRIDGLSTPEWPPLRITHAENVPAQSAHAGTREEHLVRALDERLNRTLRNIRTSLTAAPGPSGTSTAPNPDGAGTRLDILA